MAKFPKVNKVVTMGRGGGNAKVSNCELHEGDEGGRRQCPSF